MATLSDQQLRAVVQRHFGDLGRSTVDTMFRVAKAESSGNTEAKNLTGRDRSYGIFQVNIHPEANPDLASMNLLDPEQNAKAARIIFDRQGPQAWTTYQGSAPMPPEPEERSGILDRIRNLSIGGSRDDAIRNRGRQTTPAPLVQNALAPTPQAAPMPIARGGPSGLPESTGSIFDDLKAAQEGALRSLYEAYITGSPFVDSIDAQGNPTKVAMTAEDFFLLAGEGLKNLDALHQFENQGRISMGDGSFITLDDLEAADPLVRSQATAALYKFGEDALGSGNSFLQSMGLPTFDFPDTKAAQQDYENQLSDIGTKIALGEAQTSNAAQKVARLLGGLAESRARASMVTDQLLKSAPRATTPGKTAFSAGDLGLSLLSRRSGIPDSQELVRYPTTLDIDPAGLMAQGDQGLGVTGQLPQIPDMLTGAGDLPVRPQYAPSLGQGQEEDEMAGAPPIVMEINERIRRGLVAGAAGGYGGEGPGDF